MELEIQIKQILQDFENTSSKEILEILYQIPDKFQSPITQEYLKGKLRIISKSSSEEEKKKLCKNLKPYFEWYLQGL